MLSHSVPLEKDQAALTVFQIEEAIQSTSLANFDD